jgi:GNAT superfamily N-acetyltransferase
LAISAPEVLTPDHNLTGFDCGRPALNAWLSTRALANQRNGFTVVVVVVHDERRVVGYYGLSPTAVEPTILPRKVRTGQPPNPIPCLLLGQLAMDLAYAGRGIGTALVGHALERTVLGARLAGGRALLVRAIDEEAIEFWKRRGFLSSTADPYLLFRSLPDIEASLKAAGRL